jgi:Phytanoyl-CoA dioxygenase (PhyH)
VLTHQQIAHFRAFGYVVLPGLFDQPEIARLRDEVTTALADAYGEVGRPPADDGGILGDYLPLTVDRAPTSQRLVADDERLFQGAAELLGRPTVPTAPIATCFTGTFTGWHTDQGADIGGLKFLIHLEPRTGDTGALRVLPGSHDPGFAARIEAYRSSDPGNQGFVPWPAPAIVLPTDPGDAIAFDLHLLHSSIGGGHRLAWSIEYVPWPGLADADRLRLVRDYVVDSSDYTDEGYDADRWPTWREWAAGATADRPSRRTAVDRLELLGVLTEDSG